MKISSKCIEESISQRFIYMNLLKLYIDITMLSQAMVTSSMAVKISLSETGTILMDQITGFLYLLLLAMLMEIS